MAADTRAALRAAALIARASEDAMWIDFIEFGIAQGLQQVNTFVSLRKLIRLQLSPFQSNNQLTIIVTPANPSDHTIIRPNQGPSVSDIDDTYLLSGGDAPQWR
jgi:hypothetical protein